MTISGTSATVRSVVVLGRLTSRGGAPPFVAEPSGALSWGVGIARSNHGYFAGSIADTTKPLALCSARNLTLSPALTLSSRDRSLT